MRATYSSSSSISRSSALLNTSAGSSSTFARTPHPRWCRPYALRHSSCSAHPMRAASSLFQQQQCTPSNLSQPHNLQQRRPPHQPICRQEQRLRAAVIGNAHQQQQQQQRQQHRGAILCHAQKQPDADWAMAQFSSMLADVKGDPALAPLLTDPQLMAAVKEVAANPAALSKHADNPKVMAVLTRLASRSVTNTQSAAFASARTTPEDLVRQMAANSELSQLLSKPNVRAALTRIRSARDKAAELQAVEADPDVRRALDLLEAAVAAGGDSGVVDVTPQ